MPPSERSPSPEGLLCEDHEALDKLLSALLAALDQRDAPAALARLDLFWARLAMHIRSEHLHLFPAILSALRSDTGERVDVTTATAEAPEAIAQLRSDHDFFMHELAGAVKVMRDRQPTDDSASKIENVRQTIVTLRNRLEAHNKLEEELVYRLPAHLLEPAAQIALAVQIRGELENLPARFRDEAGDD